MKKQNLTKFALSIVCAAVLSACGGSSSSSTDTTTPSAAEVEAKKQADINNLVTRVTAANTANTLGLTEEQIKAFAAANYATTFADDALLEALKKFLADSTKANQSGDIDYRIDEASQAITNIQIARTNKSSLGSATTSEITSKTVSFSTADLKLDPSFDTVVVATSSSTKDAGTSFYVEDFQFNNPSFALSNQLADATDVLGSGKALDTAIAGLTETDTAKLKKQSADALKALQKNQADAKKEFDKKPTDTDKEKEYKDAKASAELFAIVNANIQKVSAKAVTDEELLKLQTSYINSDNAQLILAPEAVAILREAGYLKFADDRANEYSTLSGIYVAEATTGGADRKDPTRTETSKVGTSGDTNNLIKYQEGRRIYVTADTKKEADAINYVSTVPNTNTVRVLADTVAEVYGNKTFTYEANRDSKVGYDQINDGGNNLPLFALNKKTGEAQGAYLSRVQYGRVTSALHGVDLDDLKKGVGPQETKVVAYGKFGAEGTENHYFARGEDHISSADLNALGKATLTYSGHAVSYGLDNKHNNQAKGTPNAVGSVYQLHSGNHVTATINLDSKEVTGSIYNNWTNGRKDAEGNLNLDKVDLVTFKGSVNSIGNISGDAELAYKTESKGKFFAAIYGQYAEELGGGVSSLTAEKDAWGAVFGAHRVHEAKSEETTASPFNPRNQATN